MLELRPTCETLQRRVAARVRPTRASAPTSARSALSCVDRVLSNVVPELRRRFRSSADPARSRTGRATTSSARIPASTRVRHRPVDRGGACRRSPAAISAACRRNGDNPRDERTTPPCSVPAAAPGPARCRAGASRQLEETSARCSTRSIGRHPVRNSTSTSACSRPTASSSAPMQRERWTVAEFKAYAKPPLRQGPRMDVHGGRAAHQRVRATIAMRPSTNCWTTPTSADAVAQRVAAARRRRLENRAIPPDDPVPNALAEDVVKRTWTCGFRPTGRHGRKSAAVRLQPHRGDDHHRHRGDPGHAGDTAAISTRSSGTRSSRRFRWPTQRRPRSRRPGPARSPFRPDNAAAGLPAPDKFVSYVVTLGDGARSGAVDITFGNRANGVLKGKILTVRPAVVEDAPVVPVTWVCGYAAAPDKMTIKGTNNTERAGAQSADQMPIGKSPVTAGIALTSAFAL